MIKAMTFMKKLNKFWDNKGGNFEFGPEIYNFVDTLFKLGLI